MEKKQKKIFVAGHNGMVGSAFCNLIRKNEKFEIITEERDNLDLTDPKLVDNFLKKNRPDYVVLAAAKVGGILANDTLPANFLYENLMIQTNVIHFSYVNNVERLLFLGSSCIYPQHCKQPMVEEDLLTGLLEPTNEPYAVAKISGIKMCESYNRQYGCDFRSLMPTNLYGPGDQFEKDESHVIPALISRFVNAKESNQKTVTIWGSGKSRREFLHVDDLAEAMLVVLMTSKKSLNKIVKERVSHINVGTGLEVTINELAQMISKITNFKGVINFDKSKKDGMPRKLLDSKKIKLLNWKHQIDLEEGLESTVNWYQEKFGKKR